jgi:hypothetical protein
MFKRLYQQSRDEEEGFAALIIEPLSQLIDFNPTAL